MTTAAERVLQLAEEYRRAVTEDWGNLGLEVRDPAAIAAEHIAALREALAE